MQMQYTQTISNQSILGIIRRFCSYIDTRLTEHGTHVAYIIFRMIRKQDSIPMKSFGTSALQHRFMTLEHSKQRKFQGCYNLRRKTYGIIPSMGFFLSIIFLL